MYDVHGVYRRIYSVVCIGLASYALSACATYRSFSVSCVEDLETGTYNCVTSIPAKPIALERVAAK